MGSISRYKKQQVVYKNMNEYVALYRVLHGYYPDLESWSTRIRYGIYKTYNYILTTEFKSMSLSKSRSEYNDLVVRRNQPRTFPLSFQIK